MLGIPYQAFLTALLLHLIYPAAADDPFCNLVYGTPNYNDCRDLALQLYDGWPGTIGDRREHFFSLLGAMIPDWAPVSSRNNRKVVPRIAIHGQCLDCWQISQHGMVAHADLYISDRPL